MDKIAEILKATLAEARKIVEQQAAEAKAKQDAQYVNAGQIVPEFAQMSGMIYVAGDGDGIGSKVAQTEMQDDEQALANVSQRIDNGQNEVKMWVLSRGGTIVEAGGDEFLFKIPAAQMEHLEEMRQLYRAAVGATLTVGVGSKISEATAARSLAKLKGKDQILMFDASTRRELEMRMEAAGEKDEAAKMKESLGKSDLDPQGPKWGTPKP
jgi:hypothetical protein